MTAYPAIARSAWFREIPTTARADMRVPVRIYADDVLWQQISEDRSLEQAVNVATLPGVTGQVYAMPDVHEGYGFPVGGVAAMEAESGVISPGGVGY
ncbi:MAG TPA: RtcB family protein, partial [Gemmatimonadales bacterium]